MNRRQLIAIAGSGTTVLLAGCPSTGTDDGEDVEPLDGEWVLQARIVNEDDEPREWRVESRSQDRHSVAATAGTLPPGDEHAVELEGALFDEQREIFVESDGGASSQPWRPTECRHLSADISIVDGNPRLETECRES